MPRVAARSCSTSGPAEIPFDTESTVGADSEAGAAVDVDAAVELAEPSWWCDAGGAGWVDSACRATTKGSGEAVFGAASRLESRPAGRDDSTVPVPTGAVSRGALSIVPISLLLAASRPMLAAGTASLGWSCGSGATGPSVAICR